jgi:hypothetical protein
MRSPITRLRVPRTALALLSVGLLAGALAACSPRKDPTELTIELPTDVPQGLRLDWQRVSGADSYSLVFRRMSGSPVCTLAVDAGKHPGFLIQRDSLPSGLAHGWELMLEVRAMRHGEPMRALGLRPLKLP